MKNNNLETSTLSKENINKIIREMKDCNSKKLRLILIMRTLRKLRGFKDE